VRNDNGEIYAVRYEAVNAMLLNEFLKEHQKVAEQKAWSCGNEVCRLKTRAAYCQAAKAD
jgi:hypothetical protein